MIVKPVFSFLISIALLSSCDNHANVNEVKVQEVKKDTVQNSDSAKNAAFIEKTLAIAKASVSGEISEIEAYVDIILDSSSTKTVKYRAFKALHDRYPNAFTNIKDVKKTAVKVEEALIRRAQIKAVKETITELNEAKAASK